MRKETFMKKTIAILIISFLLILSGCTAKKEETVQEESVLEENDTEEVVEEAEEEKTDITIFNGEWVFQSEEFFIILKIDAPDVENGTGLKATIKESDNPDYAAMIVFPKEVLGTQDDQTLYFSMPDENGALLSTFNGETEQWESVLMIRTDPSGNIITEEPQTTAEEPSGKGHWEERTVLVTPAWDEEILIKKGECSLVKVQNEWDEEPYCSAYEETPVYVCNGCGLTTTDYPTIRDHITFNHQNGCDGFHNGPGEVYCTTWSPGTHHDAVYEEQCEPDEYEYVHHDAVYKTEKVWVND